MPMLLTNATATFQRLMNLILKEYIDSFCEAYLDDTIIYSASIQEHTNHVTLVIKKLQHYGLKVKISKCEFVKLEISFLGHTITHGSISPNKDNCANLLTYKTPTSITQVQSFVGLAGYYRKFIKNFSKIAGPLSMHERKKVSVE